MKRVAIFCIIAVLLCSGCKENPENTNNEKSETTSSAETVTTTVSAENTEIITTTEKTTTVTTTVPAETVTTTEKNIAEIVTTISAENIAETVTTISVENIAETTETTVPPENLSDNQEFIIIDENNENDDISENIPDIEIETQAETKQEVIELPFIPLE